MANPYGIGWNSNYYGIPNQRQKEREQAAIQDQAIAAKQQIASNYTGGSSGSRYRESAQPLPSTSVSHQPSSVQSYSVPSFFSEFVQNSASSPYSGMTELSKALRALDVSTGLPSQESSFNTTVS